MDEEWTAVLDAVDLPEAQLTQVAFGDEGVLVFRSHGEVFAVGARCTHAGMPLAKGAVKVSGSDAVLTCPAHGSQFRLNDGRVMRPPAQRPLPRYDAREVDGRIELRSR